MHCRPDSPDSHQGVQADFYRHVPAVPVARPAA